MRNAFKALTPEGRLLEDRLYEQVYEEISLGKLDKAAQARAIEEGGGDDCAVKKAYIKHRIARLRVEVKLAQERLEQEKIDFGKKEQAKKKAQLAEAERERQRVEEERIAAKHDEPLSPLFVLLLLFSLIVAFLILALNHSL